MATGVLLLGFGGPDSLQAVGPFMHNLMGREPSPALIERVQGRYLIIGGSSPITEIALAIAEKLGEELRASGHEVPVAVGMRYWTPYIKDAIAELKESGVDRVVTLSLSPFESKVAQGAYREAVAQAVEELGGIEVVEGPLVSSLPEFADFHAGAAAVALTDTEPNEGAIILFTAHSLPESDLVDDDPYVKGLQSVAQAAAEKLGLAVGHEGAGEPILKDLRAFGSASAPRAWYLVFQSKGERPGDWLGPQIEDAIDAAAASGVTALVVVPIGFMTEHMETLYDLDVVAAARALDADLEFVRSPAPNESDALMSALARSIEPLL
jgi:ferrochelatase